MKKLFLFNLFFPSFILIISCSDAELNEKEKEADKRDVKDRFNQKKTNQEMKVDSPRKGDE